MASGYGLHGGKGILKPSMAGIRPSTSPLADNRPLGPSRCFPFWQDVLACYVVNTSAEDESGKKKCAPALEDYYECLHHKKEVSCGNAGRPRITVRAEMLTLERLQFARVQMLQSAYRKAEATAGGKDNAPSAAQIRSLGLLDKDEPPKNK